MQAFKNKLKDKRGVTLLYALVFFLIAGVIGTIVLASAAANMGRFSHKRAVEQSYLSVSSAAELLKGDLEGLTFTDSYRKYRADSVPMKLDDREGILEKLAAKDEFKLSDERFTVSGESAASVIAGFAGELVRRVYDTGSGGEPIEFKIEPKDMDGNDMEGLEDINVAITIRDEDEAEGLNDAGFMERKYDITVELTTEGAGGDDDRTTLIFPVQFNPHWISMDRSQSLHESENIGNGTDDLSKLIGVPFKEDGLNSEGSVVHVGVIYEQYEFYVKYGSGIILGEDGA